MDNKDLGVAASPPGSQASASAVPASQSGVPNADGYFTLSNGSKLYVGKDKISDYDHWQIDFVERMIAAGHRPKTDDDGVIDLFVTDGGYCNGPGCADCGATTCMHCDPTWAPEPCIGQEASNAANRARRYQSYLRLKAEFEPASGIEAATADETRSGSAEGESPAPQGEAPNTDRGGNNG